jgi:hypothetical protein
MKRKLAYNLIWVFWLLVLLPAAAHPKDDTKLTKTITRDYKIPRDGHVTIVNKYGPIIINTWDKDSIHVNIEVTAFGKNDKSVDKIMDRVDFDFSQNNQYLAMATVLDRSSGFFTELWNNIGDYSKTLLSQNQLKIVYTVFLPATNDLDLTNKFGDIYLEDYSGNLEILLSHGNFRGGILSGRLDLDLSFGNADIKAIDDADLRLKATESEFKQIGDASIHSSSSEIIIDNIENLRIDSRSDRRLLIKHAHSIRGSSSFSKVQVNSFEKDLKMEMNYGSFYLNNLAPGFARLDLEGKTTEITLDFSQGNYLDFEYVGKENKLFVTKGEDKLNSEYIDKNEKKVRVNGFLGTKNLTPSKVTVTTESGEVNVKID